MKINRILGLDIGHKRIGIAISDPTGTIATGLEVIEVDSKIDVFVYLKKIITIHRVSKIVMGLPKSMDGSLGKSAKKIMEFGKKLKVNIPECKIDYFDERLSTKEALRTLISADVSRKKRKIVIDKVSAVIILQSYLDLHKQIDVAEEV
ncbi:MAG TPA: Holliday junction resolvase RuvX [Candidatus Eremiobacteraeota bacterium]|nr:Holliday junction resolvase RuvX [Candidatus Eremiobacteraeota bacterium]